MRASRLVSIVLLLQVRGRLTARELAAAMEVSVRTVYRDMDALAAAGVPVFAEAGHDGGYQLVDGYRTRLTGLTSEEAGSLFLTGLPTAAADLGLGGAATAAGLKLMAALPEQLRDRAALTAQRFLLDAPAWYRDVDPTPHLTTVATAVWEQHGLRIRYLRWAHPREVERVVEPYGLVLKGGRWYLVALDRGEYRTYRVSRILAADPVPERFDRDGGFDLAAHWQAYQRDFDRRRLKGRAELRVRPDTFAALPYLLEPAAAEEARRTAGAPGPDGWLRASIPVESAERAVPELLRLGDGVEVLGPPELRAQVTATLDALCVLYHSRERTYHRTAAGAHPPEEHEGEATDGRSNRGHAGRPGVRAHHRP